MKRYSLAADVFIDESLVAKRVQATESETGEWVMFKDVEAEIAKLKNEVNAGKVICSNALLIMSEDKKDANYYRALKLLFNGNLEEVVEEIGKEKNEKQTT